jgi:hypothetical protein
VHPISQKCRYSHDLAKPKVFHVGGVAIDLLLILNIQGLKLSGGAAVLNSWLCDPTRAFILLEKSEQAKASPNDGHELSQILTIPCSMAQSLV